jgi:hypothetical protein
MELGVVDAIWPSDEFDAGVEQFIAEQLVRGADWQSAETTVPPSGPRHLNEADQTILEAAWRRLERGRHGPPLEAILSAVEAGFREGRNSGITKARDAFAELRFSDFGRRRLARFFSRSRTPRPKATSTT